MRSILNKITSKFKQKDFNDSTSGNSFKHGGHLWCYGVRFQPRDITALAMGERYYERKIKELEEQLNRKNTELSNLIEWLKGEKCGYFLDDHKTWINYGELNDKFPYNEEDKKFELSRNRMITKTIDKIEKMIY